MNQAICVPYDLQITAEDGRVVLRGRSKNGDTWMVAMLPNPATQLAIRLTEAVRTIESDTGAKP